MSSARGEFGKGVEDAGVRTGVFRDAVFKDGGVKFDEEAVHSEDSDTDAGLLDRLAVLGKDLGGEVEARMLVIEEVLFAEPDLVTAGMPTGEVVLVEGVAVFGDFADDIGVRETVAEHEVDEFTNAMGQASHLAAAAAGGRKS